MTLDDIRQFGELIKDKGISFVMVGLAKKIDDMDQKVNELGTKVARLNSNLVHTQTAVYDEAHNQLQGMIRSTEGLNLIEFETQDIYAVNKRIERLQRDIEELKLFGRPRNNRL